MARLRVRLRGKPVYEVSLTEDRTYVAGRKEDCDIVLDPEKGISREHFKISHIGGAWSVDVLSRYGEVFYNGEPSPQFTLEHGSVFTVPPYEFEYLMTSEDAMVAASAPETSSSVPVVVGEPASDSFDGSSERTVIGVAPSVAYIKLSDADGEAQEMIRLEDGDIWIAGRESSCQIYIRDPRVSRRQFEIRRVGSLYQIIDLGSVNGTLVNGNPISSSEPTNLKSGDAITVLDNYLYFELHDAHFKSRLEMVNVAAPNPLVTHGQDGMPMPYQASPHEMMPYQHHPGWMAPMPYQYPGAMAPQPEAQGLKKFDFEKHRLKVIIGAVAFLAVAYLFSGTEKPVPQQNAGVAQGSWQDLFAKLQPEQQALVRQRYKDAKNLYMQGKYQLAQDEILKITELVPDYEDIREIERLSKEAIFIQDQQRRQEELEKARAEAEQKIQVQVVECKKLIKPSVTSTEMDECLSSVLQFNPEHPQIIDLKNQVEVLTMQREAKEAERAVYNSRVAQLRSMYNKAQSVAKNGRPLDAIAAFEKVLDSKLPDPNGYKDQSRRSIASLKDSMNAKTGDLQAEAEKYYQSQNLRDAILVLRKARLIDPTNPEISEKIDRYVQELRKQMMVLYQEGILEESFGNVEGGESKSGAKDKWKKILELDVSDGVYYKKAYLKLKKYGAL